jgi:hypothetical protein
MRLAETAFFVPDLARGDEAASERRPAVSGAGRPLAPSWLFYTTTIPRDA